MAALLQGCATLREPDEIRWQALRGVDIVSTAIMTRNTCIYESDPVTRRLIGRKPSLGAVAAWGIGGALFHLVGSNFIGSHTQPWVYKSWQILTTVDTSIALGKNAKAWYQIQGYDHCRYQW